MPGASSARRRPHLLRRVARRDAHLDVVPDLHREDDVVGLPADALHQLLVLLVLADEPLRLHCNRQFSAVRRGNVA